MGKHSLAELCVLAGPLFGLQGQHFLAFLPLPQVQGSLRPGLVASSFMADAQDTASGFVADAQDAASALMADAQDHVSQAKDSARRGLHDMQDTIKRQTSSAQGMAEDLAAQAASAAASASSCGSLTVEPIDAEERPCSASRQWRSPCAVAARTRSDPPATASGDSLIYLAVR